MSDAQQRRVARLKTIAGHLRGVQRMEREGAYCIDLIKQTQAIQAALDKFNAVVLEHHLATCVTDTIKREDEAERARVVTELLQVYAPLPDDGQKQLTLPRVDYLGQVESDVRQIEHLIGSDAYCIDIIRQAQRAKAALERYNVHVLSDHLNGCVTEAIRGEEVDERERKLAELLGLFNTAATLQQG